MVLDILIFGAFLTTWVLLYIYKNKTKFLLKLIIIFFIFFFNSIIVQYLVLYVNFDTIKVLTTSI